LHKYMDLTIWKPKILPELPISICTAPPRPNHPPRYDDGMDTDGRLIYQYQGTNPLHSDNVGLRKAMASGTPLIYFFGIEKGMYLPTWPVFIVEDDPTSLTFKVSVDDAIVSASEATNEAVAVLEARRQYVTAITMRRLRQQSFRSRVLRAYRERCAVCQLKHTELLDAAHILPDRHPKGEPVVQNGLALCKIHHAAFDRHILGITPDLIIEIRRDILEEVDGPMLKYGLQQMNGCKLFLPSRIDQRPGSDFVAERYEQFKRVS
jgi:putative restriction endonuclease